MRPNPTSDLLTVLRGMRHRKADGEEGVSPFGAVSAQVMACLFACLSIAAQGGQADGLQPPLRLAGAIPEGAISTTATVAVVDPDKGSLRLLVNRLTDTRWLDAESPLYEFEADGAVRARLTAVPLDNGEIQLDLELDVYLLSPESKTAQANDRSWQMLDVNGKPYSRMGDYVYPCPLDTGWQKHLVRACVRSVQETGAGGIYLDELGFGWQYPCYHPNHGHTVPSNQNYAEAVLLQKVRAALSTETVLYTEEIGTDVNTQYQDGSFTYAITSSRNELNPARINLVRFALPDFKLFEIIRCDVPLGNDLEAARHVFFNGEGIWLEGPLNDPKWFPPEVRQLIQKTHRILRKHGDAFSTLEPTPLVPTLHKDVYANRFPADAKTVWTLYNASSQAIAGKLLEIGHSPGAKYYDAWGDRDLSPTIVVGKAILSLDIGPRESGCVVQYRRRESPATMNP